MTLLWLIPVIFFFGALIMVALGAYPVAAVYLVGVIVTGWVIVQ